MLITESLFCLKHPKAAENPFKPIENLKAAEKKTLRPLEHLKVCRKTISFSQEPQKILFLTLYLNLIYVAR